MSEMIERMAKAIAEDRGYEWDDRSRIERDWKEWWREAARAAIEAMMEPTFEILRAGMNTTDNGDGQLHRRKWQAMLQAALQGDQEG